MRCPLEFDHSGELIVGYGARTLDPATAAAFEWHIESCAECRQMAAAQRAVWAALDESEWPEVPISRDFDQRLFRRIQEAENRGWWWRRLVPAAACAGLAIAAMFLLRQPDPALAPQASPQPALQIEQVEHALDDMDMLNQLGAAIVPEPAGSATRM
jgi:anti-sigma factor RsiW